MKSLCLLPLLAMLALPVQNPPTAPPDGSQIAVLTFKWSRSNQAAGASDSDKPIPSRAVTAADKNLERNARTARLGRPFSDPPSGVVVTDSRISASQKRIALLVK